MFACSASFSSTVWPPRDRASTAPVCESRISSNPSRPDSYERQFHDSGKSPFLVDLTPGRNDALRDRLREPRLERFIGVIYRPDTELWSHYSQANLAEQFDAFVWFDETAPVTPLGPEDHRGMPETYPFGE